MNIVSKIVVNGLSKVSDLETLVERITLDCVEIALTYSPGNDLLSSDIIAAKSILDKVGCLASLHIYGADAYKVLTNTVCESLALLERFDTVFLNIYDSQTTEKHVENFLNKHNRKKIITPVNAITNGFEFVDAQNHMLLHDIGKYKNSCPFKQEINWSKVTAPIKPKGFKSDILTYKVLPYILHNLGSCARPNSWVEVQPVKNKWVAEAIKFIDVFKEFRSGCMTDASLPLSPSLDKAIQTRLAKQKNKREHVTLI